MAESRILLLTNSRDLLAFSHERFVILLNQLALPEESIEFQSALAQFNFCASKYPNCLTLMLLKVYRSSSNEIARFQSIHLLSSTLDAFRNRKTQLNLAGLEEIKPLLISCLEKMQKSEEMKILRRIVSFVAYDVVSLDNEGWDELSDCILTFTKTQPFKAFQVFVELPRLYWSFFDRFMQRIVDEAAKVLLSTKNVEDWSLGLVTLVKMGIQILDSEMNKDLVKNLFSVLMKSVRVLVIQRMEQFLIQGLKNLEMFLLKDMDLYGYSKEQCVFVKAFMYKIGELGGTIKEVAKKIHRVVTPSNNPQEENEDLDRDYFKRLNKLSFPDIVKIFVSDDQEERRKDMAIRRLNLLLSDENPKKAEIAVSVLRNLQPLFVDCLSSQGVSESVFKVLGEVVYRVALEMMFVQEEIWFGLRDYISGTEFQRAVYIFRCLTMPLDEEAFVIPVMENLLPEISTRLNPPSEVLVDNSEWVLAFTGAFCAIIHLVKLQSHGESVKEIAYKMIDSVRDLVERGMEVGLVRRAVRDVESILKEHLESFTTREYKFVKGMLWKLYEIKGMKMESKIVLWRINFRLERGVADEYKEELPKSEFDWINQHED